jgi:hypothetical protein
MILVKPVSIQSMTRNEFVAALSPKSPQANTTPIGTFSLFVATSGSHADDTYRRHSAKLSSSALGGRKNNIRPSG